MDPSASSSRSTPDATSPKLYHTLLYLKNLEKSYFPDGYDGSTTPSSVNASSSQVAVNAFSQAALVNNNIINNNIMSQSFLAKGGGLGRLEVELPSSLTQVSWPNSSSSYQSEPLLISSPPLVHDYDCGDQNGIKEGEGEGVPSLSRKTMQKRKQTSKDDRHCSCKKSSCLKLYCDCFGSGLFCTESCRCKGCCNTPDYEDTVIGSKEQIQSRMPHAFSTKIVMPAVTNVNGIADHPHNMLQLEGTSNNNNMRHRVGCNCRKSMCKKKYCECYKAQVGCSSACRCEDCKNSFGKKDASGEVGAAEGKSETVGIRSEMANPEQCHAGFFAIQSSTSLDFPYKPLVAYGTSHLDSWSSPNCSMSRIEYQASGSHGAEDFGSFIPPPPPPPNQWDNISRRSLSSPLLRPLTMKNLNPEHNHEILKASSSTMVAVKANSRNLQQLSPPHYNIQDAQSNLPPS